MHAFDVLSDPVRRRVLSLLAEQDLTSGKIVDVVGQEFGISQSGVSQHLKVLRDNGFANVTVQGAKRLYSLDTAGLEEADRWLSAFRQFWVPKFEALATEVARGKRNKTSRANDS
ncbi:MAG: metalloregulator ArsR/SmtB family transcription factor [Pseudomonadota bacterium]